MLVFSRLFLALAVIIGVGVGVTGCPENIPAFEFHLIPLPTTTDCGSTAPELKRGQYTLRLSFWSKDGIAQSGRVVAPAKLGSAPNCSTEIKPGESADFDLDASGNPYWVTVEAYDQNGLAYTGSRSVDIIDGTTEDIYLHPSGASTCTRLGAGQARAFHSATLLPNGQVLLLGGITGGRDDQKFYVAQSANQPTPAKLLSDAEIYDPQTHRFESVTANDLSAHYAFHKALMLPSPAGGPYRLLVVGGFQSNDGTLQIRGPGMSKGLPIFHFGPTVGTKAAEARLVSYDPDTKTITSTPLPDIVPRMFPAAKSQLVGNVLHIVIAGGAAEYQKDGNSKESFVGFSDPERSVQVLQHSTSDSELKLTENIALAEIRVGHDLALLGSPWPALLWGGRMSGAFTTAGSGVYIVSQSPVIEVKAADSWQGTAWQQLSALGVPGQERSALVSGGFILEEDTDLLGDARVAYEFRRSTAVEFDHGLHLVRRDNQSIVATELGQTPAPSSYHHALEVTDGSVLVTGGTDPGQAVGLILTPQDRIELHEWVNDAVKSTNLAGLIIPRYGHQVTELRDGSFLVTGGVVADKPGDSGATAENTAEIFTRSGAVTSEFVGAPNCSPLQSSSSPMKMLTRLSPRTIKGRFTFSTRPFEEIAKARAFIAAGANSR